MSPFFRRLAVLASVSFALVFTGGGLGHAQTSENRLLLGCTVDEDADPDQLNCNVRLSDLANLRSFNVLANGDRLSGLDYEPFAETGQSTAWIFLIDRSNPRRAQTVRRKVEIAQRYLAMANATRLVGVASFANDLVLVVPPGDLSVDRVERVDAIVADGLATELFATSLEAIRILSDVDADRKALVIMSDGQSEDTAFTRQDVVQAAREADVSVFGLGFAEGAADTPALQELQRLAGDTDGVYEGVIGSSSFPEAFLGSLLQYLENGGVVSAPLNGLSGELTFTVVANFADGSSLEAQQTQFVTPPPAPEPEPTVEPEPVLPEPPAAEENQTTLWVLVLIALALLAGLAYYFAVMRRQPEVTDEEPADQINAEAYATEAMPGGGLDEEAPEPDSHTEVLDEATRVAAPYCGAFVMLDDQTNRFVLEKALITIGRHSENDFRLHNDSVHRHHAHVSISPENEVTITDLDTANGVIVNGNRIEKAVLASGDLIELGEVRFRFEVQAP